MNPYRGAFYSRQAEWHRYSDVREVRELHERRRRYYSWYTDGWLPESGTAPILDIGCGSGQFLYFLDRRGYTDCTGIDLDGRQIRYARDLGLNCTCEEVASFLARDRRKYALISMLDILEHFTREEAFQLLGGVVGHLADSGSLILSVPNAESPEGLATRFADITHELAFTAGSLGQMLFCHGLTVAAVRDPAPAPVSPLRVAHRYVALTMRRVQGIYMRAMGIGAPRYWSPVIWARATRAHNQATLVRP